MAKKDNTFLYIAGFGVLAYLFLKKQQPAPTQIISPAVNAPVATVNTNNASNGNLISNLVNAFVNPANNSNSPNVQNSPVSPAILAQAPAPAISINTSPVGAPGLSQWIPNVANMYSDTSDGLISGLDDIEQF